MGVTVGTVVEVIVKGGNGVFIGAVVGVMVKGENGVTMGTVVGVDMNADNGVTVKAWVIKGAVVVVTIGSVVGATVEVVVELPIGFFIVGVTMGAVADVDVTVDGGPHLYPDGAG